MSFLNSSIQEYRLDSPLTISDLPIEILFYIFTVTKDDQDNTDNNPDLDEINNNNNNTELQMSSKELMKCALEFSKTCKLFYKLFQEDNFWYQNYKNIFHYYSLVDVDNRCLSSSVSYSNGNGMNGKYSSDDKTSSEKTASSALLSLAKENVGSQTWKQRYFKRRYRWKVDKIDCILKIGPESHGITALEVDDRYLYSGSHDSNIYVYSLDNMQPLHVFQGHKFTIWALKSDGKRLYSGSNDHSIKIWDLKRQVLKCTITDSTKIFTMALTDDFLLSSSDNLIKLWDKKTGVQRSVLKGHTGGVNTIYSRGNDCLISGSSDRSIKIWDLNTGQCVDSKEDSTAKALSLTMIDHNLVAIGSQNCQIKIWDLRMGYQPAKTIYKAHNWDVWQLRMCGGYLFSGSFDHTIKIWDLHNFQNLSTLSHHRSYIHALTSSSFHLFSGSADKSIRVWSEQ
ncbi:hypothetical protein DLAC_00083 [Tieghemostelium lacteum]|uniref:Uncharacterized protein n=1 Tax=Tieghemostelium lacteum TaxID=361077 RepID=A0A152A8U0_TIELA|nr:hypothetical protein DLAC_00083 [Tieghemostelium lacteum]|eukprot:KYR02634.1 hypothetical protein DLAC_00083 [Tieghemostelium lacteum]